MSLHPLCNNFDASRFTGVASRITALCSLIAVKTSNALDNPGQNHNLTHGLTLLTMAKDGLLELAFSNQTPKYTECVRVRDDVLPTLQRCEAGNKPTHQKEVFQAYLELYDLAQQYVVSDNLSFEEFEKISSKYLDVSLPGLDLNEVDSDGLHKMLYDEWQGQRASGQIQPQPNLWPIVLLDSMVYLKESARAVCRSFAVRE